MTKQEITEAAQTLKNGGVIIYPTETVFGIGASMNNKEAIKRVYQIKGRDLSQPTHLLCSSYDMAARLGYINNPSASALAHAFWPGPLTLVVPAKVVNFPHLFITGRDRTIGLRIPDQPDLRKIIELSGCAILGPSANKAGAKPPTQRNQIDKSISSLVDYIVGRRSGGQKPSTIVEVTREHYKILREGPVTEDQIRQKLAEVN